jgi:ribosomal protein S18 acetylase RimI-like enzyme
MVNVVSYTQKAGSMISLTTLTPLLSKLSAGTEMASYGPQQWNFLLGGGDINAYVVPSESESDSPDTSGNDNDNSGSLLGSLLRVELNPSSTATTDGSATGASAAGFGMMLVSPAARGKGVAKLLLNEAIDDDDDDDGITSAPAVADKKLIRKLLPVCTIAGQAVYRKLGFSNVGKVTALSTDIDTARNIPLQGVEEEDNDCIINVKTFGSMMVDDDDTTTTATSCGQIDSKIKDLIIQMDSKATGYDRSKRLSFMMKNDPTDINGVKTIVATATTALANSGDNKDKDKVIIGAAIIRREMIGGPYVIGPLMGSSNVALPLVKALANAIKLPNNDDDGSKQKITVLISDHAELIDEFKSIGSFEEGFNGPAMSLDGKSIYENGDGSYLGIIHPTLG